MHHADALKRLMILTLASLAAATPRAAEPPVAVEAAIAEEAPLVETPAIAETPAPATDAPDELANLLGLSPEEAAAPVAIAVPRRSGGWLLSFGAVHRKLQNVQVSPGAHFNPASIRDIGRTSRHSAEGVIGTTDAPADRTYTDGFVNQDPGTPFDGNTWNWGYATDAQIAGDTLSMHASTGRESDFSRNERLLNGSGIDGSEAGTGPFIEAVKILHNSGIWSAGVSVSAFFVPFSTRNSTSTFQVEQRLKTYDKSTTDHYDLSAITPPPAPYEGTYEGPGPLIPNTPESRSVSRRMTSQRDVSHANAIDQELDIYHTSLSLGLRGDATFKRIALASSIGPTINWVRVNGKRTELLNETTNGATTTIDRRHDQISDDTLAIGAFIQAGAALRITERSQIALHGRYDLLDAIDGTIGPSNYAIDLDGYSLIATWLTTL